MNGVAMNTTNQSTTPEEQPGAKQTRRRAPKKGGAKKAPKKGKRANTARVGAKSSGKVRIEGSKKSQVLDLLGRKDGATLVEIMAATGWQAHTVRGFISGALIKKGELKIESFRNEEKERCYRLGK
jgi:hypothetical protein